MKSARPVREVSVQTRRKRYRLLVRVVKYHTHEGCGFSVQRQPLLRPDSLSVYGSKANISALPAVWVRRRIAKTPDNLLSQSLVLATSKKAGL